VNLFPLRRRDAALSELKVPDAVFMPLETVEDDPLPAAEPEATIPVSPANALVTELIERDIVAAVMADCAPPAEAVDIPAPLSQRHLDTIDRMVAHLKGDEKRLEEQISDARKELADTRLARHGYERSGAYLRRGIAVLARRGDPKVMRGRAEGDGAGAPEAADGGEAAAAAVAHRPQVH